MALKLLYRFDEETGLGPKFSLGPTLTFSRTDTEAVVEDHEGILRHVKSEECRLTGMRRVQNLMPETVDLSDAAWSRGSFGVAVGGQTDPNGGTTAYSITGTSGTPGNAWFFDNVTTLVDADQSEFRSSWWIKVASIGSATEVRLYEPDQDVNANDDVLPLINDGAWHRVCSEVSPGVSATSARCGIFVVNCDTGTTLHLWHPMLEEVSGVTGDQPPGEDVTSASTSNGMTETGVAFFKTTNGNTVSNGTGAGEVTEAAGTDIAAATRKGILVDGSRTNEATYSEDMTNAEWAATSVTVAQDAAGVDGRTTACTLTATGANGTVFNAYTHASATWTYSVYVKRKTGTGTVEITLDGGATYTDITASINSSTFTRVNASQTVTNPSIGFRIVTSADAIIAHANQLEEASFPSSYIPNLSTGTTTRNAETPRTTDVTWSNSEKGTWYVRGTPSDALGSGNFNLLFKAMRTGGGVPISQAYTHTTVKEITANYDGSGTDWTARHSTDIAEDTEFQYAQAYAESDTGHSVDGAAVEDSSALNVLATGFQEFNVGQNNDALYMWGPIAEVRYYNTRFSDTNLVRLSNGEIPATSGGPSSVYYISGAD